MVIQGFLFAVGSLGILAISWKSLLHLGSHGFYRFFAWECLLGLFLLNARLWFYKPFVWNQILAWLLLIASLIPLAFGIHSLRIHGKPAQTREGDPSLLAFEKTTQLVTDGVYHFIRHPLYSSLLLLTWGIFFKSPNYSTIALSMMTSFFLWLTAKADEAECIHFFGQSYKDYMKRTKRFIPYLL